MALTGDPDLYISLENKKPNPTDYVWSGVTTGSEEIIITSDDVNRKNGKAKIKKMEFLVYLLF